MSNTDAFDGTQAYLNTEEINNPGLWRNKKTGLMEVWILEAGNLLCFSSIERVFFEHNPNIYPCDLVLEIMLNRRPVL